MEHPYRTVITLLLSVVYVLSITLHVKAQPVLTAQSISMGGGASYLTGPAANFYNPANLMISDNIRRNKLMLGQGGFHLTEGLNTDGLRQEYGTFVNYFNRYDALQSDQGYTHSETLQRRFPDGRAIFTNSARYDVIAFGISFTRRQYAISLALRSRSTNAFEINRGWYDSTFEAGENGEKLVRTLRQNLMTYHEVSLGFAREMTMINGMMPGPNKLYFGIAPKLIAGGMFFEGDYTSTYFRDPVNGDYQYASQYRAKSVAENTNIIQRTSSTFDNNHLTSYAPGYPQSLLETNGVGVGLDMGFTFIMSLEGDNLFAPSANDPLRKSLRFSVSMTDIGFVSYNERPSVFQSAIDTSVAGASPETTHRHFSGQIGEFTNFISSHTNESHSLDTVTALRERFNNRLPAALHLGSALQYKRLLAAVDLEYQINPARFDKQGWHTRIGAEFRLLKSLPLRTGLSLNPSMDPILGLGAGIDTGFWEISVATQLKQGYSKEAYAVGLAVAALQFRF